MSTPTPNREGTGPAAGPRADAPPRDLLASILTSAVRGAGYGVGLYLILVAFIMVLDLGATRGWGIRMLVPLALLALFALFYVAFVLLRTRAAAFLLLLGGGPTALLWQWTLIDLDPGIGSDGILLLNRVAMALVLIGPITDRMLPGLGWIAAGFLVGSVSTAIAQLGHGLPIAVGMGPALAFIVYATFLVTLAHYRRVIRSGVPTAADDDTDTARAVGRRELEQRVVALIHDTVLGDLRAITLLNGRLSTRAAARFRADLAVVSGEEDEQIPIADEAPRDELLRVIRDFQWRGLSVDVSGGLPSDRLSAGSLASLRGALYASLDNVLAHSGVSAAEVIFDGSVDSATVMIVDTGAGFDPGAVSGDRLGLRISVMSRMEACGGSARIWSAPEAGTSVLLTAPLEPAAPTDAEESPPAPTRSRASWMSPEAWRAVPGQFHVASRYASPAAPWALGGLSLLLGLFILLVTGNDLDEWMVQLPALVAIAVAPLFVGYFLRVGTRTVTFPAGLVVLGCVWAGVGLSAWGYRDSTLLAEFWWAPASAGLALGVLVNHLSPRGNLLLGAANIVVTGMLVAVVFLPREEYFPALSTILSGTTASIIGAVFSVTLGVITVVRMIDWAETPSGHAPVNSGLLGEAVRLRLLRHELALVRRKAVPLLRRILAAETVSARDRENAAELGQELRERLTARAEASWLNRLALGRRLTIVDPQRAADGFTDYQREALTALIRGVLDDPAIDAPHLLVELKAHPDGSTAVAVSFDLDLPEGRRVMLLAPHYLALQHAVDELHWDGGESLRMRFQLPGPV